MIKFVLLTICLFAIWSQCYTLGEKIRFDYEKTEVYSPFCDVERCDDTLYFLYRNGIKVSRLLAGGAVEEVRFLPVIGVTDILVYRKYLLASSAYEMRVYGLDEPETPVLLKTHPCLRGDGCLRMDGNLLYEKQARGGLNIYSLTHLPNLDLISRTDLKFYDDIAVNQGVLVGQIAGSASHPPEMVILDCARPERPVVVLRTGEPLANAGWPPRYWISGRLLCSVDMAGTHLRFYMLRDGWNYEEVYSLKIDWPFVRYSRYGNRLLVTSLGKLHVINVDNPAQPFEEKQYQFLNISTRYEGLQVFPIAPYLISVNDESVAEIWDAADILNLVEIGDLENGLRTDMSGCCANDGLFAANHDYSPTAWLNTTLYAYGEDGLSAVGEIEEWKTVGIKGNVLFLMGFSSSDAFWVLRAYRYRGPWQQLEFLQELSRNCYRFFLEGDYAVSVTAENEICVYDVSQPDNPMIKSHWSPGEEYASFWVTHAFVSNGILYVCASNSPYLPEGGVVWLVDVQDPSNPAQRSAINLSCPMHLALYKSCYLVIADCAAAVVYEVSNPAAPQFVRNFVAPAYYDISYGWNLVDRVGLYQHYLLTSWANGGVWLYDLERLTEEAPLGNIPLELTVRGFLSDGERLYLQDDRQIHQGTLAVIRDGDLNEDGVVNATDDQILSLWIEGSGFPPDPRVADMNRDGKVDLVDLIVLRRIISPNDLAK